MQYIWSTTSHKNAEVILINDNCQQAERAAIEAATVSDVVATELRASDEGSKSLTSL